MTIEKDALLQAGFVEEKTEAGQDVLVKRQEITTLPYASAHMVDGDFIREGMVAVTTVASGMVTLAVPEADYVEGPESLDGEEGLALLKDAMASTAPLRPRMR